MPQHPDGEREIGRSEKIKSIEAKKEIRVRCTSARYSWRAVQQGGPTVWQLRDLSISLLRESSVLGLTLAGLTNEVASRTLLPCRGLGNGLSFSNGLWDGLTLAGLANEVAPGTLLPRHRFSLWLSNGLWLGLTLAGLANKVASGTLLPCYRLGLRLSDGHRFGLTFAGLANEVAPGAFLPRIGNGVGLGDRDGGSVGRSAENSDRNGRSKLHVDSC
jgi:hypothetical protein